MEIARSLALQSPSTGEATFAHSSRKRMVGVPTVKPVPETVTVWLGAGRARGASCQRRSQSSRELEHQPIERRRSHRSPRRVLAGPPRGHRGATTRQPSEVSDSPPLRSLGWRPHPGSREPRRPLSARWISISPVRHRPPTCARWSPPPSTRRGSRPKSRRFTGTQDRTPLPPPSDECRVRGVMRSRRSLNARPAAALTGSDGQSWRAGRNPVRPVVSWPLGGADDLGRAAHMDSYESVLPRGLGRGDSDLQHPMGDVGRDS